MSIRLATLLLAPLILALGACPTKQDPLACQDACSHQEERSFCDIDGVYPGTELKNECIVPPSADACNRIETCTLEGKPYCTDESMGVCVECTDGSHCGDGEVCDQSSNECIVLACTPGADGDASCVAADASLPFCGPAESCVACLVSGDCTAAASAVCDPNDFECRGCIANAECESKLCGTDTGVCASEADIVYVAKAGADGASCGTLASPCLTIGGAEGGLAKVTASRDTVVVGAGDYPEQIVINGLTVSLVGDGVVNIKPDLVDAEFAFNVTGNSNVSLDGIDIALSTGGGSNSVALRCVVGGGNPSLSFSQGTVSGSGGLGVLATGCTLSITQSTISSNARGGIDVSNSDYTIVNNFIAFNGGNLSLQASVRLSSSSAIQVFDFNTVVGSQVSVGTAGVDCTAAPPMIATGNIVYANNGGGSLDNTGCSWEYSNIQGGEPGTGNIDMDPLLVNTSAVNGDYHLQSTSPCIDAADPAATLDTDIDGDIRPQGAAHDMGADEAG